MADNLPLIPGKRETVCADVRPVLREVFREIEQLPPLALEKSKSTEEENLWIQKYKLECEQIWQDERELKKEFAERISKKRPRNIYTLFSPRQRKDKPWTVQRGLIDRTDLMPAIEQNAEREQLLWVQNVLNQGSSHTVRTDLPCERLHTLWNPEGLNEYSIQTLSMGELKVHKLPPPPPEPRPPPQPEYIICIPPQLNFVNFTLGHVHTQQIRLVNVSKFEMHLSVKPPRRRELDVELCGARGLIVTSGSAAELKVNFRPRDVRVLRDELLVRVSLGKNMVIPITCYMEPPILHIIVPHMELGPSLSDIDATLETGGEILDLGSRLLGDVHCASMLLKCDATHAAFFAVTDDAWISFAVEELKSNGALVSGSFTFFPAWWAGGGVTRGFVLCHAESTGLHMACLRILSSTATVRSLTVLADSLYFRPNSISIQAQEKDYDICNEEDPDCEYYLHLGTAFPNRSLSATIQLINHSPVPYSYYWKMRPWGKCSCWQDELSSETSVKEDAEDSDRLCPGAKEDKAKGEKPQDAPESSKMDLPVGGTVNARSSCIVDVTVPDVGSRLGTQRTVLLLILKDIPKESFPVEFKPMVMKTKLIEAARDGKSWSREVCEVVCAQMEVWWDVAPVVFVIDPMVIPLTHSRRVTSTSVSIRATQMYGCTKLRTRWHAAPCPLPALPCLTPAHSVEAHFVWRLPPLPNECPVTDVISLTTDSEEWTTTARVERSCATRHPALTPAGAWLGVYPPLAKVMADLEVHNDTYQHICWWATPYRWWGENHPSAPCVRDASACANCHELACTCALVRPGCGALDHGACCSLRYSVYAPRTDRCVATLVQVRRTAGDVARVPGAAGSAARAALLAYRVLAPRLVLRVLPCAGDKMTDCEGCKLDPGNVCSQRGCSVLRPSAALTLHGRSCYRLRITNITPIPTSVRWEPPVEGDDILKVEFLPNDFDIGRYGEKDIQVVLEAKKVCGRRLFLQRAHVTHAYKPLYLVIDAAIDGVKISLEMPLGGSEKKDSFVVLLGSQREEYPWSDTKAPSTPAECFAAEDRKRAEVKANTCHCHFELVYIPPQKPLRPPREGEECSTIDIISQPPSFTRICPCMKRSKPVLPEEVHPYCLQFRNLRYRTVETRRLVIRNIGKVVAKWNAAVRRWPRLRDRSAATEALTAGTDPWAGDVRAPGVIIQCIPESGACAPGSHTTIDVAVYADSWGCYMDQVVFMVQDLEPIVIDVWVEVVCAPLFFVLAAGDDPEYNATMWLSASDPERILRVKNTSRAQLTVHAYTLLQHEYPQDEWPFRLYMRFFDVPPRTCPCLRAVSSDLLPSVETSDTESSIPEEMDTDIDIFFAADYGPQDYEYYKVQPQVCTVPAGAWAEWRVTLVPLLGDELAPPGLLLLRTIPDDNKGDFWQRGEPAPARVSLRAAPRTPELRLSCREVRARLCALDLPYRNVVRIRKRFRVQNVGTAPLAVRCAPEAPWRLVRDEPHVSCDGCGCMHRATRGQRADEHELVLEPRSSTAMCVEVCVHTEEMWPQVGLEDSGQPAKYPARRLFTSHMNFINDLGLLQTLPLILEVNFPQLFLEPTSINFGFVTDGDTCKTYFSVWHNSLTATIDLSTVWEGGVQFELYPRHFRLEPGAKERIYLQYTARWSGGPVPAEGRARVMAAAGAGAWCRASLPVRAEPTRDDKYRAPPHDYTDDTHLQPKKKK